MNVGVLCPAEIAKRRFLPSLATLPDATFAGVGVHRNRAGADEMVAMAGGKVYDTCDALVTADEVDAVYIPSVPSHHFSYAKKALLAGKHVMIEKPFTTTYEEAAELVACAKERRLALHENFTFLYHKQLGELRAMIDSGLLGDVRLYRMTFGFPGRPAGDFRYDKEAGGGAFLDAGCYTLRLAAELLGEGAYVAQARLDYVPDRAVDIGGAGVVVSPQGLSTQIAFGMAHGYRCALEIWGEKGTLTTERIFTAPDDLSPTATIRLQDRTEEQTLSADASFANSIAFFLHLIHDDDARCAQYEQILTQAKLMRDFLAADTSARSRSSAR